MSNTTDSEVFIELIISDHIMKIVPLIMMIVGTIGNILSIMILLRRRLRKSTTSLYLVVLALSDLTVLYTGLSRHWIKHVYGLNTRHIDEISCKIGVFVTFLSLHFSSWLLVAVTIERVLVVWFPLNKTIRSNKKTAACVIFVVFSLLVGFDSHLLYGRKDTTGFQANSTEIKHCFYIDEEYLVFYKQVFPWIDLMLFSGLPFCILLIGNILIGFKLYSAKKQIENWRDSSLTVSPIRRTYNTFKILFALNTVFLVCTTPISVYLIGEYYWVTDASRKARAGFKLLWTIFIIMMYCNNTFNFLLYCISGDTFRRELRSLFVRKKQYSISSFSSNL